ALRCCEDWDLWLRLARAGARFVGLNRPLAAYRMEPGSLSTQNDAGERDAAIVARRAREWEHRLPETAPFRGPLAIAHHDMHDERAIRADIARLADGGTPSASSSDFALTPWRKVIAADPEVIPMWIAEEAATEPSLATFVRERLVPALRERDQALADGVADAWWMCCAKAADGHFGRYLSATVDLRNVPARIELPAGVDTVLLRIESDDGGLEVIPIPADTTLTRAQIVKILLRRLSLAPLVRSSGATRSPRFWGAFGARLLTVGAASPLSLVRNSRAVFGQAVRAGLCAALGRVPFARTRTLRHDLAVPVLMVPAITANDSALLAPTIGYHQLTSLIALLVAEGYRGAALREVMALREAAAPSRDQVFALVFEDQASALQCGFLDRLPPGVSSVSVLLNPEELAAEVSGLREHRPAVQFGLKIETLPLSTREALTSARVWLALLHELNTSDASPPAKCAHPGVHGELLEMAGFAPIIYAGSTPRRLSAPGVIFPGIECAGAEALGTVVECLRAA
ncbi:MAG: hypothetical protein JWQ16_1989, partial [Novosphingobium sp.]|nr:hypothetical protein [Novosphingobium sp.]